MRPLTVALLLVTASLAAPAFLRADEPTAPPIAVERLDDGLWMITGPGGNVVLCAGADGALLVDAEVAAAAPRLLAVADSVSAQRVRFLVNTHYHYDHVGGDSAAAAAGAVVVAHRNVYLRMSTPQTLPDFGMTFPAAPVRALPAVTFSDSITLHVTGREVRVFHVPPAHTDGDAVVWFPAADVLQTGDVFFHGEYPFIDVHAGGSLDGTIRAVDRLLALAGPRTRIVPGHGPLGDRAALAGYHDMLVTVRDRMTRLVRAGKTLAQLQAAKPLADLDATWGKGFMSPDDFLKVLYGDLGRVQHPAGARR
jgi:glyoxylase-like metal-dependent hydrolase (beta-lactamase superfamily II)